MLCRHDITVALLMYLMFGRLIFLDLSTHPMLWIDM